MPDTLFRYKKTIPVQTNYLNEKIQAEKDMLKRELDKFFSVNDEIIIIFNDRKTIFRGKNIILIFSFYNKTKDIMKLGTASISWHIGIYICVVFIIVMLANHLFLNVLIKLIIVSSFVSGFFLMLDIFRVKKINAHLLKAKQSMRRSA